MWGLVLTMRTLTILAAFSTIALACALYWIKYDTRRMEAHVQSLERQAERVESDIAILRAEFAYLSRPERLELLARRDLGLGPLTLDQTMRPQDIDALPVRPGK